MSHSRHPLRQAPRPGVRYGQARRVRWPEGAGRAALVQVPSALALVMVLVHLWVLVLLVLVLLQVQVHSWMQMLVLVLVH